MVCENMFSPCNGENDDINNIGCWRNNFHGRSEAVAFVMDPEKEDLVFFLFVESFHSLENHLVRLLRLNGLDVQVVEVMVDLCRHL